MAQEMLILTEENVIAVLAEVGNFPCLHVALGGDMLLYTPRTPPMRCVLRIASREVHDVGRSIPSVHELPSIKFPLLAPVCSLPYELPSHSARSQAKRELGTLFGNNAENTAVGITGDCEFVCLDGPSVVVRLTGRFWHEKSSVRYGHRKSWERGEKEWKETRRRKERPLHAQAKCVILLPHGGPFEGAASERQPLIRGVLVLCSFCLVPFFLSSAPRLLRSMSFRLRRRSLLAWRASFRRASLSASTSRSKTHPSWTMQTPKGEDRGPRCRCRCEVRWAALVGDA